MPAHRAFILLLSCIACSFAGCAELTGSFLSPPSRGGALAVWAEGPSNRITSASAQPQSDTTYFDPATGSILLRGAARQTVACQVVVVAGAFGSSGMELHLSDFAAAGSHATLSASNARLYVAYPLTVSRFPAWYLRLTGSSQPVAVYDVLVPLDAPRFGQPLRVGAGERLVFWCEVSIPPGQAAGRYEAKLSFRSAAETLTSTTVILDVLPLELPATTDPSIVVQLDATEVLGSKVDPELLNLPTPEGQQARSKLVDLINFLAAHHLSAYTHDVFPTQHIGSDGAISLDWSLYDQFVAPLLDAQPGPDRAALSAWPIPIDVRHPRPDQFGGPDSAVYARVSREILAQAAAHFEQRRWLDRNFVWFNAPEPVNLSEDDFRRIRQRAKLVELADKRLRFLSTVVPQQMRDYGWADYNFRPIADMIDILAPRAQFAHAQTLQEQRNLGKTTWLLPDRPPFSGSLNLEAPPTAVRSLPWQAVLQGHEAVWLPRVGLGPADILSRNGAIDATHAGAWLAYPGSTCGLDRPIPSWRLKQLQLGQQEAAMLRMLEKRGRAATARLLASSLIKAAGTDAYVDSYLDADMSRRVQDPQVWDLASRTALAELVSGGPGASSFAQATTAPTSAPSTSGPQPLSPSSTRRLDPTAQAEEREAVAAGAPRGDWDRLLRATRGVEAAVESVRIASPTSRSDRSQLIEVTVSARNDLATPVDVSFSFTKLPRAWQPEERTATIEHLAPNSLARTRLRVRTGQLAMNTFGHATLPLVFEVSRGGAPLGRTEILAQLAALTVEKITRSIRIDGALDDWSPGNENVAGDFGLTAAAPIWRIDTTGKCTLKRGAGAQGQADRTVVYLCHDDKCLYVGFRCKADRGAEATAAADSAAGMNDTGRTNTVTYDDLIPTGEDLVEVLLNPTNLGTESSDMYHIVLKATGPLLFERGVSTPTPIGERGPWSADIRSAVRPTADGWAGEIAIPFDSIDTHPAPGRVWGVNFTRFEPSRGSYSNWAGAARYCYNPTTFGTILLPSLPKQAAGASSAARPRH